MGISEPSLSEQLSILEENGYIKRIPDGQLKIIHLTELGKDITLDTLRKSDPAPPKTLRSNTSYYDSVRVHDFKVISEIDKSIPPVDRWFETWAKQEEKHFEKVDGGYITYLKGFKARFTSANVIIFLGSFQGEDVRKVKNRAMSTAEEAFEYIKEVSPVKFKSNELTPDFRVAQQEIALEPSVLGEFLKYDSDVDINEVFVDAPDGRRRIHIDQSGEVELEFTHPELAEEDARFWKKDFLKDVAENKDSWRDLFSREKEGYFEEIKEIIGIQALLSLKNTVDDVGQQKDITSETRPRPSERHTLPRQQPRRNKDGSPSPERGGSKRGLEERDRLRLLTLELRMYRRMDNYRKRNK